MLWFVREFLSHLQLHLPALARRFGVSQTAMRVRLMQMGLVGPSPRCRSEWTQPSTGHRGVYYRHVLGAA
jgi:hypothetical protein